MAGKKRFNFLPSGSLNGTLRHAQPDKLLEAAARTKVRRYREAYATRPGVTYAFLPCVMRTSGRIHGEFLRFLYILAHRRTKRWFLKVCLDLTKLRKITQQW